MSTIWHDDSDERLQVDRAGMREDLLAMADQAYSAAMIDTTKWITLQKHYVACRAFARELAERESK